MIVVLKPEISKKEEKAVLKEIRKLGYKPHVIRGVERTVIGAIGDERTHHTLEALSVWPQVEKVMPVQKRYKLVSREGASRRIRSSKRAAFRSAGRNSRSWPAPARSRVRSNS